MKARISFVRLLTKDFDESYKFYSETLGLKDVYPGNADSYAEFETGSVKISLFDRSEMAKALGMTYSKDTFQECQDKKIIILEVDNVEDTADELRDKGVIFLSDVTERKDWNVKTFHLRDPDGNIIEINSPLS